MPENQNGQGKLAESLTGLLPTTRWGWLMLAGGLVWFVNWVFTIDGEIFGSGWLKTIIDLLSLAACIPLFYFLYRGSHWVVEHLLWRLRRRLIITYLLIGVLPLVLVLVLVALCGYLVIMQSSSGLVGRQLDGYLEQSQSAARALSRDLNREESLRLAPAELRAQLQERANALAPIFPEATLAILRGGESSSSLVVTAAPNEAGNGRAPQQSPAPDLDNLPRWLGEREQFHGLVVTEAGGRRQVRAHHFIRLLTPQPWIFQLTYPIGPELAEHLTRTTDLVVRPGQARLPFIRTPSGELILDNRQFSELGQQAGGSLPSPSGYPIITSIIDWRTGTRMESEALEVDPSFLWPGQIWRRVQQFRRGGGFGEIIVNVISGLAVIFLLITLVAIVSAIFLTRSITGAVHYLYQGTRRIEAGDFDHEIPIRGRDQLSSLGISFNQMTQSVRKLLRVSAEKERLDQEMKIAAEVQARLFPRAVPSTQTLDIAPGICIPARAVSGDYYDFLDIAPGVLGVVVADVCGKGASAALMMANLQANLRGQVLAYRDAYQERLERAATIDGAEAMISGRPDGRVKRIVERANRQITGSMMDANYVTLFYAEFDEQAGTLHYTNAGHNPPLLLRGGRKDKKGQPEVERLDCGGTVIGLFLEVEYEDRELLLESGDLLVAFTDGLIEARSPQGQEFGEDRLIRLLAKSTHLSSADLEKMILKTVKAWTANAEQEDDLTLVIVKRR